MGIERPEDVDAVLQQFDRAGDLDTEGLEDGVVALHDALGTCGANPEDPRTYRAILAVARIFMSVSPLLWPLALNELCRCSLRAMRDLNRRGGGE